MHKKYQLMLDIHLGSMSLVATPACSMLLNLMVNGNGSFTALECVSKEPKIHAIKVKATIGEPMRTH